MNIQSRPYARQYPSGSRNPQQRPNTPVSRIIRRVVSISIISVFGCLSLFGLMHTHANGVTPAIVSGISGYCLDDYKGLTTPGSLIDLWNCDGTTAQRWTLQGDTIVSAEAKCLSVSHDGLAVGSKVVVMPCNSAPGQVWLRDQSGYLNPNSDLCLAATRPESGAQLSIDSCQYLSNAKEKWTPLAAGNTSPSTVCNQALEGERVACVAEKAWTQWQTGSPDHGTLLNQFSDGNGYEEWCADFISYVYKEAGYPFSQGERDSWDEYDANNIQYQGFTFHDASDYIPKAGDIAYFDYSGGHVEIVVSGGSRPTFIYGDSATVDPATGNGQMEANTIVSDGSMGQVVYYLSPQ